VILGDHDVILGDHDVIPDDHDVILGDQIGEHLPRRSVVTHLFNIK